MFPISPCIPMSKIVLAGVRKHLPGKCGAMLCVSQSLIGCNRCEPYTPLVVKDGVALSACCFSNFHGMQVEKHAIVDENFTLKDVYKVNPNMKAALLFCAVPRSLRTARNCCGHLAYVAFGDLEDGRQFGGDIIFPNGIPVAIGGGRFESSDSPLGSIVTFSGSNIQAGTVIIKGHIKDENVIRSKFLRFKNTHLEVCDNVASQSYAFNFSYAESSSKYSRVNLICSVFNEIFPHIPIIGYIGMETFGREIVKSPRGRYRRIIQGDGSVFVVIALRD
ncbi:hypothetical protein CEXT_482951 [Caerostris extrusa]|uniref:Uncharacterized protein n=1 Tax=Caerostris extrusa TaxID=172846 RepID=A0AAV4S1K9_CAEEX|nr:hypothetical protein CEXT_482951 [Caerostris extrusa]